MRRMNWLTSLFRRSVAANTSARRAVSRDPVHSASQPIEQLESRELLAVFSVNSNVADGAAGSLRAAIQNANANQADDTIYLTPGRYVLSLDNSVAETTVGDRGDLDVTESGKTLVLQGSGTDSTILDAAGLDRVLEAHPGSTLVLRDLTLTGGKATQGGGLFATGAKVVLENVTVRQNEAESGGGIALSGGQMTMSDSLIEANIAKAIAAGGSASGGGIRADSADVRIHNSTISGNSALAGNGRSGQSVHEVWKDGYGIPNFYGARIGQVGGDATGGAIAQKDGLLVVTNSVIGSNRAQAGQGGDGGNGGSMYEDPGQVPVSGNLGGIGGSASGGGIFADGAEVTLSDAIVSKNSAIAGNTGADRSTNWSLANSSKLGIAGASASGAGIFINAGQLEVAQSVVVQNSAEAGDGGNGPAGGFDWDDRYFVGSKGGFPGGIGGTGGSVFGSGIFGSSSSVQMIASTISGNVGNAGRGGTGGKGGSGFYVNGGAGGTGGKGGDVNGLGVYLKSGTASTDQSSIQSNNGSAGVGGSGGSGGYGEFRYSGRDASSGRSGNAGTVGAQVVGTISNTDSTTTTTVMLPAMTGSFELRRDGDDVVLRDSNQTDLFRANASDAKRLEIIGSDGDDTVIVDASIAELNVLRGLKIDGGGGTNTLQLRGTAESVSFSNFTTGVRGEVTIDRQLVEWANVSTLQDTVIAKARDFAFSAADDVVEVTDGAAVADGISQLRVNGTSFDFTNPTESLRIDARGGADRVTLTSIDAGMKAAIVVAGGGGDDQLVSMLTTSVQLLGGDGNDSIRAGTSGDSLIGGNGNDSLFGGLGTDLLIGGAGDDVLFGGAGNDRLMGEAGRDMLTGNSGLDSLFGGDDDDTLRGGAQNDALDGGNGFDQVLEIADNNFTLTSSQLVVQRVVANSVDPNAVPVVGSALEVGTTVVLADNVDQLVNIETASLIGGVSSNRLDASKFAGPATLRGFNGDDTLLGGSNDDVLEGDEGNDQLDGGTGVNRLLAEGDRDWRLTAGQLLGMGTDSFVNIGLAELRGGVSANRLDAVAFLGQVTLLGGEGDDTLLGSNQADVLIGDGGNDQLIAKGGNDSLTGGDGDNTLNGGPGIDRVVESGDVDFTLTAQQLSRTGTLARLVETSNNDVVTTEETGRSTRPTELWNIEEAELTGGAGNNRLSAKKFGGAVTLRGGDGNDTLEGGSVADVLDGGAGRDRLLGRAGDDTLLGGTEKDLLLGGDGNDQLNGGDGADVLNGEAGADHLMGDAGNDRFEGDFASDTLDGGEGRDAFELKSSGDITLTDTALTWTALTWTATATLSQMEQVTLRGDAGSQRLDASGFSGSTTLDGVAGDDSLLGARGDDLLLVASLNTSTVDGGAGFNTLARSSVLGSGESSYDLATTTANLDRISRIDLRGPDLVSLTLHARQFIATSGKGETLDLQLDSNDQLTLADVGWKNVRTQNGRQELIQATRHLDVSAGVAIQQSSAIPAPPGAFLKSEPSRLPIIFQLHRGN